MANCKYHVDVLELKEVHEIPGAWSKGHLLNLLSLIEYAEADAIPDEELKEMTAMALSDLEADEAAKAVLEVRFGDKLTSGQRQHLAEELKDDRLWEQYAEIGFHEELFNVGCMLNWAFSSEFPVPDMVKLRLKITAQNAPAIANVQKPTAAFIARLLTDGMDEHNAIFRLFEENITSDAFPESEDIIWRFDEGEFSAADNSKEITVYTSWNWVDDMKGIKSFESTAHADGQLQ